MTLAALARSEQKRTMIHALAAAATLLGASPVDAEFDRQRADWNRPVAPFRIAGNVYYVGTAGVSAFLVTTPRGHILIDGGFEETAPRIATSIETLGFKLRDVRHLLINHAHWDHAGGLADLKRRTGATLWASVADRATLEAGRSFDRDDLAPFAPVKVDRVIGEGGVVAIGGVRVTARLTPGHTQGCTSFTTQVADRAIRGGRSLDVAFACSLSVAGQQLVNNTRYPTVARDYDASFAKLRRMKADIYLTFHPDLFGLTPKRARGTADAFVDRGELRRRVDAARAAYLTELARQRATR
jgi:metallo-beta-lactamase class B